MHLSREIETIIRARINERAISADKKIILYPFGNLGKECKRILNSEYGIIEDMIIDNKLCEEDAKIKSLSILNEIDTEGCIVILTSSNIDIYDEIREELFKYISEDNVIDLFGYVNLDIDRRIESLRLMANTINELSLEGAIAEAGVYKGDFAKHMNRFFKDRALYLFDTFEGFEVADLKKNVDEGWNNWMNRNHSFADSRIELILDKMRYPEKCIIKKGFFPESAKDVDDKFCFVNLDMDIYQSTKDGLEFFWPKMVKRGIIMIHDYNNKNCKGVKKAVNEFAQKYDIGIGCLSDYAGSAILIK